MIFLALGSNLGDRAGYLSQAQAELEKLGVRVLAASRIHETPALMPEGAPAEWNIAFLNQVLKVETAHSPHALLALCKQIEQSLGRQKRAHWAPREIDVDILAYHDEIITSDALALPHPQLHQRLFVLEPLAEIAPDWLHPSRRQSTQEMLHALRNSR